MSAECFQALDDQMRSIPVDHDRVDLDKCLVSTGHGEREFAKNLAGGHEPTERETARVPFLAGCDPALFAAHLPVHDEADCCVAAAAQTDHDCSVTIHHFGG